MAEFKDTDESYYEIREESPKWGVQFQSIIASLEPRREVTKEVVNSLVDLYRKGTPHGEALKALNVTQKNLENAPKKMRELYLKLIEEASLGAEDRKKLSRALTDKIAYDATVGKNYEVALEAIKLMNIDPEVNIVPSYLQPPGASVSLQNALGGLLNTLPQIEENKDKKDVIEVKAEVVEVKEEVKTKTKEEQ